MNSPEARVVPDTGDFDVEVDVLVAGAGGCGLVAGLAAAHAGAETLVLEKFAKPQSNTARSGVPRPTSSSAASFPLDISRVTRRGSESWSAWHLGARFARSSPLCRELVT